MLKKLFAFFCQKMAFIPFDFQVYFMFFYLKLSLKVKGYILCWKFSMMLFIHPALKYSIGFNILVLDFFYEVKSYLTIWDCKTIFWWMFCLPEIIWIYWRCALFLRGCSQWYISSVPWVLSFGISYEAVWGAILVCQF